MFSFRSLYFDDPPAVGRAVDIFPPDGPEQDIAVFFIHGGGWTAGSRAGMHCLMRECGRRGHESATTDYRLVPGSLFNQIEDVRTGLRLFMDDLSFRGKTCRMLLHGSSAGGHLALMAALLPWEDRDDLRKHIVGVAVQAPALTFEPWPDILPQAWQAMQNAVGASYGEAPELFVQASPLRHIHPAMPPVLIMNAQYEEMFPLDLTEEFQRQARAVGGRVTIKQYPRAEHGFLYSLDRWQQRQAFEDMMEFAQSL
ncbi:MAG: alpha/beta hydrolase [Terrimicrobiaceae bacterium]